MLHFRLHHRYIFSTLFLIIFLAACGSTSEPTAQPIPTPTTPTPPPATETSATETPAASQEQKPTPAPQLAPDFSKPDLLDSNHTVRLSDYRGHIVFLNFWASWCPPCRAEMPDFETVFEEYDGEIIVLGVGIQDDPDKLLTFANSIGITYPIISDPVGEIARHYSVRSLPTTYLINPQGEVASVAVGGVNRDALENVIQRLRAESTP